MNSGARRRLWLILLAGMLLPFSAVRSDGAEWERAGDAWKVIHPAHPMQRRVNRERAEKYLAMTDEAVRALISDKGSADRNNVEAKNAAYDLAALYNETKDAKYAHKAAVILDRLAEVFPAWPFRLRNGDPVPRDQEPPYFGSMWENGWFFYDLEDSAPLVQAWDLIHDSGAMEALGEGTREKIMRDLLQNNLDTHWRYPRMFGNVDGNQIAGLISWGLALGDPEMIHKGVRWLKGLYNLSFYPSGAWHESPSSYHIMITCRLEGFILDNPLKGYSDPPGWTDPVDGTRYDNIDLATELRPEMEKVTEILRRMVLPNGRIVAIHDATWTDHIETASSGGHQLVGAKGYIPQEAEPYIIYDFGHGYLARGKGKDQVQAHLHFSGTNGHEHLDNLNIILFAKGKELLSETHYRGSAESSREWQASTAGHNTVVIDERDQARRGSGARMRPADPVLDSAAGWPEYAIGDAHNGTFQHGNLLLWEPTLPGVQVAEADGDLAWHPDKPDLYRRTLAMVESGGEDVYLVDLFRVDGGGVHDWMLHGNLEEDTRLETNVALAAKEGTIHGGNIGALQAGAAAGAVEAKFVSPGGETVRTIMLPAEGTKVIVGRGPAMRRDGKAPFLDIRRRGPRSLFAAVHEPYAGEPRVSKVSALEGAGPMAAALRIELPGGRVDYFLSTMGADEKLSVKDGALPLALEGRIGFVSTQAGKVTRLYLLDGARLTAGDEAVEAESGDGTVVAALSQAGGADRNAFELRGTLPAEAEIVGRTILLTDGEGTRRGFEIAGVERDGATTRILLASDPTMRISDGVMKLLGFPHWGVKGEVKYHIAGRALRDRP